MMFGIDKSRLTARRAELAALLVLTAGVLFYAFVLRPAEAQLARLETLLESRTASSRASMAGDAQRSAAAQLGAFYAFFGRELGYTEWLERFYDVSRRTGVTVQKAEYRRVVSAEIPLVLYEVELPVSGDYRKVRAFAEGVLAAIPVVSLDRISLRRQKPDQDLVDASLKFTLYLPVSGAAQ